MSKSAPWVVALAAALLIAACAGAPATAPTPAGAATPAAGGPDVPPAATDGDDADGDDGDAPHQVPDLEAMLPAEVGGIPLNRASISGRESVEELNLSDDIVGAIEAAGRSVSEAQLAVASPDDSAFFVMALRVPGLDAGLIRAAIVAGNDPDVFPVREGQIAGKQVTSLADSQFYYARGDILFVVFADVNTANELISRLP